MNIAARTSHVPARLLLACGAVGMLLTATPAGALQRAEREDRLRVEGRVREVRGGGRTFTLETDRVTYRVRYVGGRTGRPGFGLQFPDLHDGDRVEVRGSVVRGTLEAEEVVLRDRGREPGEIQGRVTSVDGSDRVIYVRPSGRDRVRVEWNALTSIQGLGYRGRASDIDEGDTVWVYGRWLGSDRFSATRIDVTSSYASISSMWRSGDSGRIYDLGERLRKIYVEFGGVRRRVDVQDSRIYRGSRRIDVEDLRVRDRVRVEGSLRNGTIYATRVSVLDQRSVGGAGTAGRDDDRAGSAGREEDRGSSSGRDGGGGSAGRDN